MKYLSLITGIVIFCFASCKKLEPLQPFPKISANDIQKSTYKETFSNNLTGDGYPSSYCGAANVVNLLAGQHIEVGTVTVTNDREFIYVTYTLTSSGWSFGTLHLYVGTLENAPTNKSGNPVPGRFPLKASVNGSATSYTFTIPIEEVPECYIVAAHAEVNGHTNETAWGNGTRFVNKGNWGMFFNDCVDLCDGEYPL